MPHNIPGMFPTDIQGLINSWVLIFQRKTGKHVYRIPKTQFGGGKEIDSFSESKNCIIKEINPACTMLGSSTIPVKPWLTQLYTRLICDEFYGNTPEHGYGYGQDEDQGQLGDFGMLWLLWGYLTCRVEPTSLLLTKSAVLNSVKSRFNLIPSTIPVKHS